MHSSPLRRRYVYKPYKVDDRVMVPYSTRHQLTRWCPVYLAEIVKINDNGTFGIEYIGNTVESLVNNRHKSCKTFDQLRKLPNANDHDYTEGYLITNTRLTFFLEDIN